MKIWMLNQYASAPGQQVTRCFDLGSRLVSKGHEVTIFASSFDHYTKREQYLKAGEDWKQEVRNGVRFIWVRTTPYSRNDWRRAVNMISYCVAVERISRSLADVPDAIIGTCAHIFAPLVAYRLAKRYKARFFFEVADLWPQTLVDMGEISNLNPVTWGMRAVEKHLFARADAIISILPNIGAYLDRIGIKTAVACIPNGVDLLVATKAGDTLGEWCKPFKIFYTGGHASYHGLDTLLEAAHQLQNKEPNAYRFVLIGDGAEKSRLICKAAELQLHNVEFRDLVPKGRLYEQLAEADALYCCFRDLPVLRFGVSPIKLFDYLAAARPILYAIKGSNNPVQDAGAGVTIEPESAPALAEAIAFMASLDPEARAQMGRNGLRYVQKNHEIGLLAQRLESVLVSICSGASANPESLRRATP